MVEVDTGEKGEKIRSLRERGGGGTGDKDDWYTGETGGWWTGETGVQKGQGRQRGKT